MVPKSEEFDFAELHKKDSLLLFATFILELSGDVMSIQLDCTQCLPIETLHKYEMGAL